MNGKLEGKKWQIFQLLVLIVLERHEILKNKKVCNWWTKMWNRFADSEN